MSKIEEKTGLKTGQAIALLAIFALGVLWLIALTVQLAKSPAIFRTALVCYVQFVLAAFYACCGYKKPHGNLMRYLLLFYAASLGAMLVIRADTQGVLYNSTYVAVIILSTYMAGRLNKYQQNVIISLIILAIKFVNVYPGMSVRIGHSGFTFVNFFGSIGPVVIWLAIAASYLIRFKPHKEAGLADKN